MSIKFTLFSLSATIVSMKKEKVVKIIKELLIALLIVGVVGTLLSAIRAPEVGTLAPNLTGKSIDGQDINLKELKEPFILHFWATWCGACKMEAGNIQKVSEDFEVITVAVKSGSAQEVKEFLKERGYNYKVVNDANALFASYMKVGAFPTTFFYNAKGELVLTEVGYTSTFGLYARIYLIKLFF